MRLWEGEGRAEAGGVVPRGSGVEEARRGDRDVILGARTALSWLGSGGAWW